MKFDNYLPLSINPFSTFIYLPSSAIYFLNLLETSYQWRAFIDTAYKVGNFVLKPVMGCMKFLSFFFCVTDSGQRSALYRYSIVDRICDLYDRIYWFYVRDSLGFWDRGVMTRPVSDRPRSWSWSYTFGLASNSVVPDKTLCDMIMLKCNKHLYFLCNKCRNSAKHNWSSYHFLTFFYT